MICGCGNPKVAAKTFLFYPTRLTKREDFTYNTVDSLSLSLSLSLSPSCVLRAKRQSIYLKAKSFTTSCTILIIMASLSNLFKSCAFFLLFNFLMDPCLQVDGIKLASHHVVSVRSLLPRDVCNKPKGLHILNCMLLKYTFSLFIDHCYCCKCIYWFFC